MSIALEHVTCFHAPPTSEEDDVEPRSSLIGRCEESGGKSDGGDEEEVQSSLKGPLDTMDSLEDALPASKSKSSTILSSSTKEESSSSRKRKNLPSIIILEQSKLSNVALSKRPANSNRAMQRFGHSMSSSSSACSTNYSNMKICPQIEKLSVPMRKLSLGEYSRIN